MEAGGWVSQFVLNDIDIGDEHGNDYDGEESIGIYSACREREREDKGVMTGEASVCNVYASTPENLKW